MAEKCPGALRIKTSLPPFAGVLEAESRWHLEEKRMGGEDGKEGNEYVTFITFKQLG